jgi:diketogulonate reductase-like aldo/keto reductase
MAHHVPRESLFITSKLWNTFHNPDDIEPTLDETLRMLQTEYLDLYLIHWPIAQTPTGGGMNVVDWDLTERPIKTWLKLEELVRAGKIRNIGTSKYAILFHIFLYITDLVLFPFSFNIRRLQNLTASPSLTIQPAINQVELNYWNPQPELLAWSKAHNVLLEAYSPLGGDGMVTKTLKLPVVQKISKKLKITPAQVIISWHVQRGTVVLPKSVDPGRISENYQRGSYHCCVPQCFAHDTDMSSSIHNSCRSFQGT